MDTTFLGLKLLDKNAEKLYYNSNRTHHAYVYL